jgi:hypothetical protein
MPIDARLSGDNVRWRGSIARRVRRWCSGVIAPLQQRELYWLGLLVTLFFLAVFLVIGTAWILVVT